MKISKITDEYIVPDEPKSKTRQPPNPVASFFPSTLRGHNMATL